MAVEQVLVVRVEELNLSIDTYENLANFYEASNDTYHRYYPESSWDYIKPTIKNELNDALQKVTIFPEQLKGWYILLRFDW